MAEVEITNKLLKEAIADAELLVKTAQENAKISLEESFTPQIKSMLSRRLRAESEGMEAEDEEEKEVEKKEAPEGEEKEAPKATAPAAPKMETAKELPFQDGEPEGSSEMPADSSAIGSGDNKEPSADAFDSADDDMSGEDAGEGETLWYDDWSESDFDLDEVIKELEEEMNLLDKPEGEEEGEEKGEEEEEKADEAYPDEDPEAGVKKPEIPADSSDIGTAEAAEADSEKLADAPSAAPAPEMGAEKGHDSEMEAGEEEELDLEQILRELEAEDEAEKQNSEKMASLEKELAEYRKAVNLLRGKLHEVNLLNAKLLYTNRIFRKEGLTTEQKVTIVENFDRAASVREVKMVYAVLVETLTSAAKAVKTTKAPSKVVAEGLASKATPSTAPKTPAAGVIAENSVAKRLQQLAGIIS